jgi:hypothetical protein
MVNGCCWSCLPVRPLYTFELEQLVPSKELPIVYQLCGRRDVGPYLQLFLDECTAGAPIIQ